MKLWYLYERLFLFFYSRFNPSSILILKCGIHSIASIYVRSPVLLHPSSSRNVIQRCASFSGYVVDKIKCAMSYLLYHFLTVTFFIYTELLFMIATLYAHFKRPIITQKQTLMLKSMTFGATLRAELFAGMFQK